jgi:glycosyltransferase involved in cell wall biosynthesis
LRVLLTCKKRGWNGETACIFDLARGCRDAGHEVLVGAQPDSEMRRRALASSLPVLELRLEHALTSWRALASDVRTVARVLREVDLVHTNASWDTWVVAFARRASGSSIPFVRTRHNLKTIEPHRFNRWLYGRAIDCVVAPSQTVVEDLRRQSWLATRLATIHYGIDVDRFDPARHDRAAARVRLRTRIGAAADAPVIAYVSRVVPRKSPEVFVEAAARLRERFPAVRFVLAGALERESDWAVALRDRVGALAPSVLALEFVEDVPALLAGCDAFVLPAPNEPFGLAPVEAMAMGCPPVCAAAGGFVESIADGETGLLFEPGNVDACAAAIAQLLEDEPLRARLAAAGRARVLERFTTKRMVAQHLALYEELARGKERVHSLASSGA